MSDSYIDRAGNLCERRVDGSYRVLTVNDDKPLTIQSERESVEIHSILSKYRATGILGNQRQSEPQFGDFSSGADFADAQQAVIDTKASFNRLDSSIRKRFGNNPANLLSFLEDPTNRAEAVELGLVNAPPIATPQASQVPQGDGNPGEPKAPH